MNAELKTLSDELQRRKGAAERVRSELAKHRTALEAAQTRSANALSAQAILQRAAGAVQSQLEYRLDELVSLALEAVFGKRYGLKLRFEPRRGKTEADLVFVDEAGNEVHPMDGSGGGCVDVAALALRCAMWSMARPRTRALIVMDEPLKNINDDTRRLHQLAAQIVRELSDRLGLQFLIVSQVEEFKDIADRVFEVARGRDGRSTIKESQ